MSRRGPLIVLVVFVVVSAVLTWTVASTLQRGVNGSTHTYSARFSDVSGLAVGDDVRMAGVRVGRVDSIRLDGTTAQVSFAVRTDQTMYGDTKVSVTYQNLIGQRYLGLSLGAPGPHVPLRPGAVIPETRTEPSFDISRLLRGFEPLFGTLDPGAIDNISDALVKALQGDAGSVANLVAQTTQLAESFTGPDQVLGAVITNLSTITDGLAKQTNNLNTVIEQTRKVFSGLQARRESLFDDVDVISRTVARASEIVEADRPDINEFLDRKPGFAEHFVQNSGKYEYLGFNLPYLLKGISRLTQTGPYLEGYVCNIRFTAIPGLAPLIPDIVNAVTPGGTKHTVRCRP